MGYRVDLDNEKDLEFDYTPHFETKKKVERSKPKEEKAYDPKKQEVSFDVLWNILLFVMILSMVFHFLGVNPE